MKNRSVVIIAVSAVMWLAAGCAKKEMIKLDESQNTVDDAGGESTSVDAVNYYVKPGDSLWSIASGSNGYGNAFEWPLIFRANRDQIQDPDLIDEDLQLSIKKNFSQEQREDAIQKAKNTPPFKSHSEPRKTLSLKY